MHKNDDPNQSLGFIIHDTARLLRKNFERRAQAVGLTRSQWSVLSHLRRNDGLRQTDLAALLEIEPISLARLIDRLEKDMWVERRNDPVDRRTKRVFLTEKVTPVLDRMCELGAATRADALRGISSDDQKIFMEILLRIRTNVSEQMPAIDTPKG